LRDQYDRLRDDFYGHKERYTRLGTKQERLEGLIKDLQRQWLDVKRRWWAAANSMGGLTGVHAEWGRVDDRLRRAIAALGRVKEARQNAKDKALQVKGEALDVKAEYEGLGDSEGTDGSDSKAPGATATPTGGTGPGTPGSGGATNKGGSPKGGKSKDVEVTLDKVSDLLDFAGDLVSDPKTKEKLKAAGAAAGVADTVDRGRAGLSGALGGSGERTKVNVTDAVREFLRGLRSANKPGGP
jgi:hypothetical protein